MAAWRSSWSSPYLVRRGEAEIGECSAVVALAGAEESEGDEIHGGSIWRSIGKMRAGKPLGLGG